MSWDAYYSAQTVDGPASIVCDKNFTHNTNEMIEAALGLEPTGLGVADRILFGKGRRPWYWQLDGATGADGRELLGRIVSEFEANPDKYRAMDSPNGWGTYDHLLPVLREMRDACTTYPVGRWEASG
jgi:hypothetical protein